MRVVSDALQLFGGNGLTREYPMEKLFRDARAAQIEDGENMMLNTRLGFLVQQLYEDGWTRH
ncbi:Acyl-CoA dehydrogenase [compost metagenome]